jgi:hypothetical protein
LSDIAEFWPAGAACGSLPYMEDVDMDVNNDEDVEDNDMEENDVIGNAINTIVMPSTSAM